MKRFAILLLVAMAGMAQAEEPALAKEVKASLIFRAEPARSHPQARFVRVYLHLENLGPHAVQWVCDIGDIQAEFLDEAGHPFSGEKLGGVTGGSWMGRGPIAYSLPYHSTMEWMIAEDRYDFTTSGAGLYIVGFGLIPHLYTPDELRHCFLKLRIYGVPHSSDTLAYGNAMVKRDGDVHTFPTLFDFPATPIVLTDEPIAPFP